MHTHAPLVRLWFELPAREKARGARSQVPSALPNPNEITLVTGPSGAGKSRLVAGLRELAPCRNWLDVSTLRVPGRRVIDCFGEQDPVVTLELLSRVGLAEAWTYLRPTRHLSAGQRFRLTLALAVFQARDRQTTLVLDEFAAVLDRVTACVVARAVRRIVSQTPGMSALVATSHDDLTRALAPDRAVRCDFYRMTVTTVVDPIPHLAAPLARRV